MSTTTNLGLKKPTYSDFADVKDLNDNMDILDSKYGTIAIDKIYPVGSIYMSVNSTNPGTLFGGTWSRIQGKFLLAADTSHSAGSTGGNETKIISTANLPSHSHSMNNHVHSVPSHSHSVSDHKHPMNLSSFGTTDGDGASFWDAQSISGSSAWKVYAKSAGGVTNLKLTGNTESAGGGSTGTQPATNTGGPSSANTGNTGSGTALNIMPPYLSVYMWQRTA